MVGLFIHSFLFSVLRHSSNKYIDMFISRSLFAICLLCLVHGSLGKPSPMYLTEARGIGSTLWDWITYPFTWWSSESGEPAQVPDQLLGSTTYGPFDNIEIAKHNVTVWCNDHTCTTMKCDKFGCKNVSCNIYDTNMNGECREYNVKPDRPVTAKPAEVTPVDTPKPTEQTPSPALSTETGDIGDQMIEERPLELEAVLSSSVTEASQSVKKDKSSSQNKI